MKHLTKLAGVLLFALLTTLSTFAAKVQLAWDANPTNENVTAYVLYWGTNTGNYQWSTNVGTNLTATITNAQSDISYYFAVTARDGSTGLESDYSDQVWLTIPNSNMVVRTVGATNVTRTNVALVGIISNVPPPYSAFFEYIVGTSNDWHVTNVLETAWVTVTNATNWTLVSTINVVPTNYTCRLIVTNLNGAYLYVAGLKQFKTVPPSKPSHIKFETKIIQTADLTSTNWHEVMTASVTKDYPPDGVGFLRSRMDYFLLTNYPANELVVVPTEEEESPADTGGSGGEMKTLLRARPATAGPPTPGL